MYIKYWLRVLDVHYYHFMTNAAGTFHTSLHNILDTIAQRSCSMFTLRYSCSW